ncbi:hypothetical protein JN01_0068 [Entomoplasma freundtii]|uniref:Uncharacterized protein n=1 Tax=Entomoplasma freundtii TaxID=74700 RepID=A0A2K8NS94_9MOLU|nr:hypothetical protein [Entomoplasma freundtii]ATZ16710.1 hypothetical protein EFREU_v1c06900 [Entomoplasma freundtii]TDY58123.1 hypothetical protein JN01_0068 [Entomoplasma freundtii]
MIYWNVKFYHDGQLTNIDDYYNSLNLEEQKSLYENYSKIKQTGESPLRCASKVNDEECGCVVIIKNTSETKGFYELAKLKSDYHKTGCISETVLYRTQEVIPCLDLELLLEEMKNKKNNYIPGVVRNGLFQPSLKTSENPKNENKSIIKNRVNKTLDLKRTLDYIFKRDQPNQETFLSGFEMEYKNNCYKAYDYFFTIPKIKNIFKWNWKKIPEIRSEWGELQYITMPLRTKEIISEETKIWVKFRLQDIQIIEKINKIKEDPNYVANDYSFSLLTSCDIKQSGKNWNRFESIQINPFILNSDEFIVVYNNKTNTYKRLSEY